MGDTGDVDGRGPRGDVDGQGPWGDVDGSGPRGDVNGRGPRGDVDGRGTWGDVNGRGPRGDVDGRGPRGDVDGRDGLNHMSSVTTEFSEHTYQFHPNDIIMLCSHHYLVSQTHIDSSYIKKIGMKQGYVLLVTSNFPASTRFL